MTWDRNGRSAPPALVAPATAAGILLRLLPLLGVAWTGAARGVSAQEVSDPGGLFLDHRWSAPPAQQCEVLRGTPLPPLGTVFDTVVLTRGMAGLGAGSVVVSVNDVSGNATPIGARPGTMQEWHAASAVVVVEATWPDPVWPVLAERIGAAFRPGVHGSFVLRIDSDSTVTYRMAPSVGCRPVLIDRDQIQRALGNLADRGYRGRAVLTLVVDTDGAPAEIVIERTSGSERVDHLFTVLAQTVTLLPALLNRVPVKALLTLPLANR